jgi:hypothetical protein
VHIILRNPDRAVVASFPRNIDLDEVADTSRRNRGVGMMTRREVGDSEKDNTVARSYGSHARVLRRGCDVANVTERNS